MHFFSAHQGARGSRLKLFQCFASCKRLQKSPLFYHVGFRVYPETSVRHPSTGLCSPGRACVCVCPSQLLQCVHKHLVRAQASYVLIGVESAWTLRPSPMRPFQPLWRKNQGASLEKPHRSRSGNEVIRPLPRSQLLFRLIRVPLWRQMAALFYLPLQSTLPPTFQPLPGLLLPKTARLVASSQEKKNNKNLCSWK